MYSKETFKEIDKFVKYELSITSISNTLVDSDDLLYKRFMGDVQE